jgi:hypothetical protein
MAHKLHISVIVGIAALMLGAQSALAKPPELTTKNPNRAAFVRAARFFKEGQRTAPVSVNLSVGQDPNRAAFVRAARFFKESQRITPVASSPEHADFWNYESGVKVADASPGVAPEELATLYGG